VTAKMLLFAGLILLVGGPLGAQTTSGSISGVVQDAQGAVVPTRG
jgi:hypothetical protein